MAPHCGFDLHFSDNEWCWASFHVFVTHLHVSLHFQCSLRLVKGGSRKCNSAVRTEALRPCELLSDRDRAASFRVQPLWQKTFFRGSSQSLASTCLGIRDILPELLIHNTENTAITQSAQRWAFSNKWEQSKWEHCFEFIFKTTQKFFLGEKKGFDWFHLKRGSGMRIFSYETSNKYLLNFSYTPGNVLVQCLSNVRVNMNHPGILFKFRFWFNRAGERAESLNF